MIFCFACFLFNFTSYKIYFTIFGDEKKRTKKKRSAITYSFAIKLMSKVLNGTQKGILEGKMYSRWRTKEKSFN